MKHMIGKIVVTGGVALALAACGASAQTDTTTGSAAPVAATSAPAAAASLPTAGTGSNSAASNPTAAPGTGAPAGAGPNQRRGGPGIFGKVVSVNGSTVTIQDQRQQNTTTVDLTGSTQIFKQTSIDLANVPVGQSISAVGTKDGNVFTATQVRIGMTGGPGMRGGNGPSGAGRPQPNGTAQPVQGRPQPNGTAQAGRGSGNRLFGVVDQVSGDTVTVKAADGSTTQLKLAANGQVTQQVAGTTADITANEQVAVMGQQNGTTLTASQIDILPAMMQQP